MIVPSQPNMSIVRQTELLGVSRASFYHRPKVNEADISAMKKIDEIFTKCPFYGSRRIRHNLETVHGIVIGRNHVRRLMGIMGLEAIYPKAKKTSVKNSNHKIYPYLLRHMNASFPNHVWGSDITYIHLAHGFCYLYAIIDWWSRLVVGWDISPTMESDFCVEVMRDAIKKYGTPEFSNTDQGSQFTDKEFIDVLAGNDVKISMDGRGRCMDNIFTERLWRSVKYEEVYLKSYENIDEAKQNIAAYFRFYNSERPHQSHKYQTPATVYENKKRLAPDTKSQNTLTKLTSPLLSTTAV